MDCFEFDNLESAERVLTDINKTMGFVKGTQNESWNNVIYHPTKSKFVLLYNDRISECKHLFKDSKFLSEEDAISSGYYFGFHEGRYGKLLDKIEEMELLLLQIKESDGKTFYVVQKTLLLGITYSFYSIAEALFRISSFKNKKGKINNVYSSVEQQEWWIKRESEIYKKGELIHYFIHLHNSDKHDFNSFIKPKAQFSKEIGGAYISCVGNQYMVSTDGTIYFGAEGVFKLRKKGNILSRIPISEKEKLEGALPFPIGIFQYELVGMPTTHLGQEKKFKTPYEAIDCVKQYFESIIIEATEKFK
ncbi:MAG: hypothetical protein HRT71_22245 [Flavobacteriales bacterium]|nr:hypothetical protein [Flavobacteriales bacterium]